MKSTGEVMGLDRDFGMAFAKSQLGGGTIVPESGRVFVSVRDRDKEAITALAGSLSEMGFDLVATGGTARHLAATGLAVEPIKKVYEGRPNIVDHIVSGDVGLLINTPLGKASQYDDYAMRRAAITYNVPYLTTMSATSAACDALIALRNRAHRVKSLQERVQMVAPVPAGPR